MKVAIVAQGASWHAWRRDQPEVDEVWAINTMGLRIPHDMLFHMDDCRVQEARAKDNPSIATLLECLRGHARFVTSTKYPEYPGAVEFPLQEVVRDLGLMYFNSTVAYAVAMAVYIECSTLYLYGVDFSYPHAHKAEKGRGCVEHLLGIARARGMRIVVPAESTLLDAAEPEDEKPYGYCDAWHLECDENLHITRTPRVTRPSAHEMETRYGSA